MEDDGIVRSVARAGLFGAWRRYPEEIAAALSNVEESHAALLAMRATMVAPVRKASAIAR